MPAHRVDQLIKQIGVIVYSSTDDDPLSWLLGEGDLDDRYGVVVSIQLEQADLNPKTAFGEPGSVELDAVCHRLRIPLSRHAGRIEPDHEHPW
jgi:hypothetical protein